MKIPKRFNQLTPKEYFQYIANHKKYTNFNTLGLYRSILENPRLNLSLQKEILAYANQYFAKTYQFLQLRDPFTYVKLSTLGEELTVADERQKWNEIQRNQQRILQKKRIKHRNFGTYSKHDCGYESCVLNGIMIQKGSWFAEAHMYFESDQNDYVVKEKSLRRRKERKQFRHKKRNFLETEYFTMP